MLGGLGWILEILLRFSGVFSCLSHCFKITAHRAGHLTIPDVSLQEKLLLHDLSLATIQSILLLSSKEAHWSCQFWLQHGTSNLGLQQPKLCLLRTEIYLGWGSAGCRRKNNRAETFLEAQRQNLSWCESSTAHSWSAAPVLSAAQSTGTDAACLSLEAGGATGVAEEAFHTFQRAQPPQGFRIPALWALAGLWHRARSTSELLELEC